MAEDKNTNAEPNKQADPAKGTNDNAQSHSNSGEVEELKSQLQKWQAKAVDLEKKWQGLDPDKTKADLADYRHRLTTSGDEKDYNKLKTQIEEAVNQKVTTLENENKSLKELTKRLRVTNEAMKYHSEFFVEGSEEEIKSLVDRYADFDEESGQIIFKDAKGQNRYSQERGGKLMDVKEFFKNLSTERKYLAKAQNKGGTMGNGTNSKPGEGTTSFGMMPNLAGLDARGQTKALAEWFKANPEAKKAVLAGKTLI